MSALTDALDAYSLGDFPSEFTHVTWGKAVMEDGSEPTPERLEYWRKRNAWAMKQLYESPSFVRGLGIKRVEEFPRNPLCFCSGCGRVFVNCTCPDD